MRKYTPNALYCNIHIAIHSDTNLYELCIFNQDPDFLDTSKNKLMIGDDSAANGQGNSSFASQVPFDILNVSRTASPDLGAYQHITFED